MVSGLRNLSNELDKKALLAQGRRIQTQGDNTRRSKNTSLLSRREGLAGRERDRCVGSSAELDATAAAAAEATGSCLMAGWPLSAKSLFS